MYRTRTNKITRGHQIAKVVRKLLFPPRCPGCDEVQSEEGFCKKCARKLVYITEPVCKKCGKQLKDDQEEYCYDCRRKKHYFEQGKGVYQYSGPTKQMMYRLKYSNRRCYGRVIAKDVKRGYGDWIIRNEIEAIIPVPMYHKKKCKRGYNQAQVLAEQISKQVKIPIQTNIVLRIKNTRPQKGLNDAERQNNLKNAFKIRQKRVQLHCVLIVDDIYTTGSTIDAVAEQLNLAGVKRIYFLGICMGQGF